MEKFDFATNVAAPEWLTSVLSKNGFLSKGEVSSIKQDTIFSDKAFFSSFYSLKIEYAPDSEDEMPEKKKGY